MNDIIKLELEEIYRDLVGKGHSSLLNFLDQNIYALSAEVNSLFEQFNNNKIILYFIVIIGQSHL